MNADDLPRDDSLRLIAQPRLRTLVAGQLRRAIASNRFVPGTRLKERELCALLGVSRTSVREALRELESEGLVSTKGGRPIVTVLTLKQVEDVYQVRVVLEGLAARLFARNASNEQMKALAKATDELAAALKDYVSATFLAAKVRFYEILFEGAGNEVAAILLNTIHTQISLLRSTSLSSNARAAQSVKEIRALLVALKARDEEASYRLCVEHIVNASRAAMTVMKNPDDRNQSKTFPSG